MPRTLIPAAALLAVVGLTAGAVASAPKPIAKPTAAAPAGPDFNAEVRPILARHCFKCHGPDDKTRMAGLRLDVRADLVKRGGIVPGNPAKSTVIQRMLTTDHARVMPPMATKNPLTAEQKSILQRWVASGARYDAHWAFIAPKSPALPPVRLKSWPRNPIDHFVLARLERTGLKPSPEADRYTLARRVHLDLIGIPPTPVEAEAFVNDPAPAAYEKLVDRLLADPRYGERWARKWLDLARYADTNGYEKDRQRSIWPYRDWVIKALNADLPFNQFTVEQLAGDMLPNATVEQRIATGFHRNTMLNEEGGIDPLEYRFHSMADRVLTTGTTWLGLTVGCAQCHTHKFDPITHREYYQFMAFLNNADEPEYFIPRAEVAQQRADTERKIAQLEAELPSRFPPAGDWSWHTARTASATTASGAKADVLPDGSVRISGTNPNADTYTLGVEGDGVAIEAIRLEALTDSSLGMSGPGRTPHGNFVLGEITVQVGIPGAAQAATPVKFASAMADFSQEGFPAAHAIDGNPKTGWAIHGPEPWNRNRTLTLQLAQAVRLHAGQQLTIHLDQNHGTQHTLGRFRISFGERRAEPRPMEVRRKENLDRQFSAWLERESAAAVKWTVLKPHSAKSNSPLLTVLDDATVYSSGDITKRDVYELLFKTDLKGITAVRLEALPDDRLPRRGPGRIYYEGPFGDFHLSEVLASSGGQPVKIAGASQSFGTPAAGATDGNPQTGWSVNGGQGQPHIAVFNFAQPLDSGDLKLDLVFERYYAAGLGKFRVSVSTDPNAKAGLPPAVEAVLATPADQHTGEQKALLLKQFLAVAPEVAADREQLRTLRAQMPEYPLTLVMHERPAENPRRTFIHNRGEYLQPKEPVEPGTLSVLHPFPSTAPRNRLEFAKWLVDPRNPLVGRVTVNRQWAAIFGQGIVRTTDDFGYQGETPSHPELLDWLATVFTGMSNQKPETRNQKLAPWSLKSLHRLIVTSATYRQSSRVTPELAAKDPQNKLLARGPRGRIEAELVRDTALAVSGLLSRKLYGPSVFPPQPAGVTSEGTYGALQWKVSEGEDRYRRGLYTFSKRTAPYAMFLTFDAPSGEACVARREVSNTPLQALTLLNDQVFLEAAQALGKSVASHPGTVEQKADHLFRLILSRPPQDEERHLLIQFHAAQLGRLESKTLDAGKILGAAPSDVSQEELWQRAGWTLAARSLLNLDEAVSKR